MNDESNSDSDGDLYTFSNAVTEMPTYIEIDEADEAEAKEIEDNDPYSEKNKKRKKKHKKHKKKHKKHKIENNDNDNNEDDNKKIVVNDINNDSNLKPIDLSNDDHDVSEYEIERQSNNIPELSRISRRFQRAAGDVDHLSVQQGQNLDRLISQLEDDDPLTINIRMRLPYEESDEPRAVLSSESLREIARQIGSEINEKPHLLKFIKNGRKLPLDTPISNLGIDYLNDIINVELNHSIELLDPLKVNIKHESKNEVIEIKWNQKFDSILKALEHKGGYDYASLEILRDNVVLPRDGTPRSVKLVDNSHLFVRMKPDLLNDDVDNDKINIKICVQDKIMSVDIGMNDKFGPLIRKLEKKIDLKEGSLILTMDGDVIEMNDTPESLALEDEDQLDSKIRS